jgi:hypothetical protein
MPNDNTPVVASNALLDGTGHWNGEPCQAETGTVVCGKAMRLTWWCASLEGKRLKCVKVLQDGYTFFLNDEDGSGSHKVFETRGGPWCAPHASIPVDDANTFIPSNPSHQPPPNGGRLDGVVGSPNQKED